MNPIAFVGPALKFLGRGVNFLSAKSDQNPKTSGVTALLGAGATWMGLRPQDLDTIGSGIVKFGALVQAVAQAMGG